MPRSLNAVLIMICLLALVLPGPLLADTYTLTEKDSGRTVTLQVGEKLLLNLRNPGSGGYNVLPPAFNPEILTFLHRRDLPPTKSMPGDFGRIEFAWEARRPGNSEVAVNIARPWEKDKPPEQFVKIRVRVQN